VFLPFSDATHFLQIDKDGEMSELAAFASLSDRWNINKSLDSRWQRRKQWQRHPSEEQKEKEQERRGKGANGEMVENGGEKVGENPGICGADGSVVYFISIIDTLQLYNLQKKVERFWKVVIARKDSVRVLLLIQKGARKQQLTVSIQTERDISAGTKCILRAVHRILQICCCCTGRSEAKLIIKA
jgi:hypothetical protein